MKIKKLLSFLAAAAISASAFAGLTVTTSAAESTYRLKGFDAGKLAAGSTYDLTDDEGNVGLTVKMLDAANLAAGKKTTGEDGIVYGNPGVTPVNRPAVKNGVYSSGFAFELMPEYDGTITVYYKLANNKTMELCNAGDASLSQSYKNETGANQTAMSFDILADNTYIVAVGGSGNEYYGFKYTADIPDSNPDVTEEPSEAPSTEPDVTEDPTATPEPTAEPTATPTPNSVEGVAGTVDDLVAASETTTYDLLATAVAVAPTTQTAVYNPSSLYFNNQIYIVGDAGFNGLLYYDNKTTANLDGSKQTGGIRIKKGQDVFAVKLAPGAAIETPVYGGGGGARTAVIATDVSLTNVVAETGDLGSTAGVSPQTLTYTNATDADMVVYVTATGDSFISQVKVTVPEKQPTETEKTISATINIYDNKAYADGDVVTSTVNITAADIKNATGAKWSFKVNGNSHSSDTVAIPNVDGSSDGAGIAFGLLLTGATNKAVTDVNFVVTIVE